MLFLLTVLLNLHFANSLIRRDYSVHAGKNITIPCIKSVSDSILWTRDGNNISSNVNVNKFKIHIKQKFYKLINFFLHLNKG